MIFLSLQLVKVLELLGESWMPRPGRKMGWRCQRRASQVQVVAAVGDPRNHRRRHVEKTHQNPLGNLDPKKMLKFRDSCFACLWY